MKAGRTLVAQAPYARGSPGAAAVEATGGPALAAVAAAVGKELAVSDSIGRQILRASGPRPALSFGSLT